MKRLIVLSVILAVTLLVGNHFSHVNAQDPVNEEKPTFYRLIPGVYVNGWPRFTVTYPKDWVERLSIVERGLVHAASSPGDTPHPAIMRVAVFPYPFPLDKWPDDIMKFQKSIGLKDVILVSDKESQLQDGTPAREVEFRMVANMVPRTTMYLITKKGNTAIFVLVAVNSQDAKIKPDLKAILYSLQFEPGKDEPVKVPPDVQEFLDKWSNDIVSHDLAKVMSHYSDRYINSGVKKGEMERFFRQVIGPIMSTKETITDFVPTGDRAYLTGFVINNFGTFPITDTSIIKENGEWKWYGNQREVISDTRFE